MHRSLIFFFIFLLHAIIINSYTLLNRADHTANYINNKIYFLGGHTDENPFTNDFFYLDVSKPFNTFSGDLQIVDLANITYTPKHARATSTICGSNKDTIFIVGGDFDGSDNAVAPLVFAFNANNPEWYYANIRGIEPIRRRWLTDVCDKNGKMYIFGGTIANMKNRFAFRNDFDILDTTVNSFIWERGSNLNIPPPVDVATATLLPDGRIVYLGGNQHFQYASMSKIHLYDTIDGKWKIMYPNGPPPSARCAHTSVLTLDGRIIVYGGDSSGKPTPDLVSILDTTVHPFRWTIPHIGFTPASTPFRGHTATLVGNYMIVAFGLFYDGTACVRSNQIHILYVGDKNNYKWVINFSPDITVPQDPGPQDPDHQDPDRTVVIVGGIVIGVIFVNLASIILIISYRHYKMNEGDPAATPLLR